VEGSDNDVVSGTVLEFAWRTEENHEKFSVRIAGLRAEIWSQDLPNTKQIGGNLIGFLSDHLSRASN
jgi:hypothetical protein